MIHPVSNTTLPSVMCTWSRPLFSICFVFLDYFIFLFFYATCLALHETTARVCICSWAELCRGSVSLPKLLPGFLLEKLLQSRTLPSGEGLAKPKSKSVIHGLFISSVLKFPSFRQCFGSELHCKRGLQLYTEFRWQHLWVWFLGYRLLTPKH